MLILPSTLLNKLQIATVRDLALQAVKRLQVAIDTVDSREGTTTDNTFFVTCFLTKQFADDTVRYTIDTIEQNIEAIGDRQMVMLFPLLLRSNVNCFVKLGPQLSLVMSSDGPIIPVVYVDGNNLDTVRELLIQLYQLTSSDFINGTNIAVQMEKLRPQKSNGSISGSDTLTDMDTTPIQKQSR
jgi:hypothetical protein